MDQTPKRPLPIAGSPILDQQPERAAVRMPRGEPPKRSQTLPQMAALRAPPVTPGAEMPRPPPLPVELGPTVRAPSTTAKTIPTPALGQGVVRIESPSSGRAGDREALLESELAKERAKVAQLERDARAAGEAKVNSFPPAVVPVAPAAAPVVATEPATEAVIAWLIKRAAANRKAIYAIVAAIGLGGGGVAIKTANEKPAPPALTKAELDAALDKLRTRKGGFDDQTRMLNEQLQLTKCLRRKVVQIGESVLPAPDHMGNVRKPQPFEDDCPDAPKPLPDP